MPFTRDDTRQSFNGHNGTALPASNNRSLFIRSLAGRISKTRIWDSAVIFLRKACTAFVILCCWVHSAHGGEITCGECPQIDYWIASSRDCDQQANGCCEIKWHKHLKDTGLRDSSVQEFRRVFDPNIPVCIFAHGSFVNWKTCRLDALHTNNWLRNARPNQPIQFIFFAWPSDRCPSCPQFDYGLLGRRASRNGIFLAQMIRSLPRSSHICLIGHSHGTRASLAALHLLGGGEIQGRRICLPQQPRQIKTILVAAAVDRHWLNPGERFSQALCQTQLLVNIVNHKDFALGLYPLRRPWSGFALGRAGFSKRDLRKISYARCRVQEIDVTAHVRSGHLWPSYYQDPELAQVLAKTVW